MVPAIVGIRTLDPAEVNNPPPAGRDERDSLSGLNGLSGRAERSRKQRQPIDRKRVGSEDWAVGPLVIDNGFSLYKRPVTQVMGCLYFESCRQELEDVLTCECFPTAIINQFRTVSVCRKMQVRWVPST
jgi:hypothetical protein